MYPLPRQLTLTIEAVRTTILDWYERSGRSFPWREADRGSSPVADALLHDPYMILVCETMLQQTQTARVVTKLDEFLGRFPDVAALAAAPVDDLLRAWQGMGYNRRALRLRETALAIVEEHGGRFPRSVEELRTLPGIGPYTASAIACFAFGAQVPVVDVNVERLLARLFFPLPASNLRMPKRTIDRVAAAALPQGEAYRWHQALMDIGATICTARAPSCEICPLATLCASAFPPYPALFTGELPASREPTIAGLPRRIWRGRIIERLRTSTTGVRVADLLDELLPNGLFGDAATRHQLLAVIATLANEGMLHRVGLVAEGEEMGEEMVVALGEP